VQKISAIEDLSDFQQINVKIDDVKSYWIRNIPGCIDSVPAERKESRSYVARCDEKTESQPLIPGPFYPSAGSGQTGLHTAVTYMRDCARSGEDRLRANGATHRRHPGEGRGPALCLRCAGRILDSCVRRDDGMGDNGPCKLTILHDSGIVCRGAGQLGFEGRLRANGRGTENCVVAGTVIRSENAI